MESVELSTEENEDEGRPIQFVYVDKEKGGSFTVNKEAIDILKSIKEPVGVISVCGKYRTGKSYLLNKVILNQKSNGFSVGPTINACTKGLLIWSKPINLQVHGQKMKVVVIDSEGMGCTNSLKNNDQDSLLIFLLSLLLSSYFIYNSIGIIDENAIQNLSIITQLSNELLLKESPNKLFALKEISSFLPSFLWVIRDFSLRLVDDCENPITPKEYLEKALKEQRGLSEANKERNRVREILRNFFPNRDCYTLVRPVEDETMLQNLESIDPCDLRPEFLDGVKGLKKLIFQQVKPKYLYKDFVNGSNLIEMCISYVNSINNGKIPSIESVWTYLCQFESEKQIKECASKYSEELYSYLQEPLITLEAAEEINK